MKPFYINVYQDHNGQWYGGQFASRRRAAKAASTVSSKCVGRLRVRLKLSEQIRRMNEHAKVDYSNGNWISESIPIS
jgi:hypothetical protein